MPIILCAPTLFALEVPVYLFKEGQETVFPIGYFQMEKIDETLFSLAVAHNASTIVINGDNEYNRAIASNIRAQIASEYSTDKITVIIQ